MSINSNVGEGSYSSVYHVRRKEDGLDYALKKVNMGSLGEKEKQNAINEVRILASIKHPCVSSYKEAFVDEGSQALW
jgi:NIMA (never in mitosis gene a)-related kinase 1/4/5